MNKLKAVFWDVDGTIADTEMHGHRVAFNKAFFDFDLDWYWDKDLYSQLLKVQGGCNRIKYYASIRDKTLDNKTVEKIHLIKQDYYRVQIKNGHVPLRKGVKRLFLELHKYNIHQWVVTTSKREPVEFLLSTYFGDVDNPFHGEICFEDVSKLKPDPQAYLFALDNSGFYNYETLAIEDSIAGMNSASSAGITTLITKAPWDKTNSTIFDKAACVTDSLGDYPSSISIKKGPQCKLEMITLEYLDLLLSC